MADRSGQQLGNYRVIRLLGKGGFAEVYLGEHIYLKTHVAIKLLTGPMTPKDAEDFIKEAQTAARLIHPNIVRVLDFGIDDTIPFLVMDYASKGTLRQRYPKGTTLLSQWDIVPYIKQIAAALQYAHNHKVIHRDVKPENMLFGDDGEVLLGDFGIAITAHLTHSMSLQNTFGTVHYMAPEHIQGKARPASDQYSLAIVVYELLCGESPFTGSTPIEIAMKHHSFPPPPLREKKPTVSPAIEEVVLKALAKDPNQRFASIQDFADVLEQTYHYSPHTLLFLKSETLLFSEHSGAVTGVSWSPNGQCIASGSHDGTMRAWEASTAKVLFTWDSGVQDFSNSKNMVNAVVWSPDGKRIACGTTDGIAILDATTKQSVLNYRHRYDHLAWSLDGKCIVSWHGSQKVRQSNGLIQSGVPFLYAWDMINQEMISTFPYEVEVGSIAWSPNGKYIVVTPSYDDEAIMGKEVSVWDVTSRHKLFTYNGHRFNSGEAGVVAWSPDGTRIASGGDDNIVQIWEASTGFTILTCRGHSDRVNTLSWSPNGKQVASGSDDSTVQIWDVTTRATGRLILTYRGHSDRINALAWSPDGKQIASGGDDKTVQVWRVV